jgi:hypothetical protein
VAHSKRRARGTTPQRSTSVWTRACSVAQQPASWVGIAGVLATLGGRRGRRAAWRGLASYTAAALAANVVMKPLVRRRRPPEAGGGVGRITSSFPSGHSATEVAFALGAAQRLPGLLAPLLIATAMGKWSIIRSRGHYVGDVVVGSIVGVAVSRALWKAWPPRRVEGELRDPARSPAELVERLNHYRFRSTWSVPERPCDVYPVLQDLDRYPLWWPEVKAVTPGATGKSTVLIRALLPYSLRFTMSQGAGDAGTGTLESQMEGDLTGWSRWTLTGRAGGSSLLFEEDVGVGKRSLRILAPVARPLFRLNHTVMMRRGQKGLRAYLEGPSV